MANLIKKNVSKGTTTGIATALATVVVYVGSIVSNKYGFEVTTEAILALTVSFSAIFAGIYDAFKHRK